MNMRNSWAMTMMVCLFVLGQHSSVRAQNHENPALPSCGVGIMKEGNPGSVPSVIKIKFLPGCVIP